MTTKKIGFSPNFKIASSTGTYIVSIDSDENKIYITDRKQFDLDKDIIIK